MAIDGVAYLEHLYMEVSYLCAAVPLRRISTRFSLSYPLLGFNPTFPR